jgi:nucleotide-binding universal stress UspA family protein
MRLAEASGADLIVIATHGGSSLRRLTFGSVTSEILPCGAIPILAILPRT